MHRLINVKVEVRVKGGVGVGAGSRVGGRVRVVAFSSVLILSRVSQNCCLTPLVEERTKRLKRPDIIGQTSKTKRKGTD
jgi:hypothetical protein